jgi:tetratricopeptide (TPR) repeat protein
MAKKTCLFGILCALLLWQASPLQAQEVYGADRFLKLMAERRKPVILEPPERFYAALKAYNESLPRLTSNEATKQWLALIDDCFEKLEEATNVYDNTPLTRTIQALPSPKIWDEIAQAVHSRKLGTGKAIKRERGLRMLAHALTGNYTGIKTEVDSLEKDFPNVQWKYLMESIRGSLPTTEQDIDYIFRRIRGDIKNRQGREGENAHYYSNVSLDALESISSNPRVAAFLKEILTTVTVPLEKPKGTKTLLLAKRVALEQIKRLAHPQWVLAQGDDNITLYEAMERRFPPPQPINALERRPKGRQDVERSAFDRTQRQALGDYLINLARKGKTTQALARLEREGVDPNNQLLGQGRYSWFFEHDASKSKTIFHLLRTLLQKRPELFYWGALKESVVDTRQTEAVKGLFFQAAKRPNLHPINRSHVEEMLYNFYLEEDKVAEAVNLLRATRKRPRDAQPAQYDTVFGSFGDAKEVPNRLAELGATLHRPDLVLESLKYATEDLKRDQNGFRTTYNIDSLCEVGKGREAERYLWNELKTPRDEDTNFKDIGESLFKVYHALKRYGDMVYLLDRFPDWGITDLLEQEDPLLLLYAAEALAQVGRTQDAVAVLEFSIESTFRRGREGRMGKIIKNIEILVNLRGEKASPYFEKLLSFYPDTPELLYAKALICQKTGWIKEAPPHLTRLLQVVQNQASLDGDFTHAVLVIAIPCAEAQGDTKQVASLRALERSTHLLAQANEYAQKGLWVRHHKLCQEAYALTPNRMTALMVMGVIAEENGKTKEAEQYYETSCKIRWEALTNSPNPNHLFIGTQNALFPIGIIAYLVEKDALAQKVQERFYSALCAKEPRRAMPHYLLSGVRFAQGRKEDAIKLLLKATEVDETFLPAWGSLLAMLKNYPTLFSEREDIALRAFQHIPYASGYVDLKAIENLKKLWYAVESVQDRRREVNLESVYVLQASRLTLEQNRGTNGSTNYRREQVLRGWSATPTPGEALRQNRIVSAIFDMIVSSSLLPDTER